jgi:4-hydroxyacetophenone monooxygenase
MTTTFATSVEPIDVDDETLRGYLAQADIPALLPALAFATGDLSLLRPDLRPDPLAFQLPGGGLSEEQQQTVRDLAFDVLVRFRDGDLAEAPDPDDDALLQILEQTVGGSDMGPYLRLLSEEIAAHQSDPRAPGWRAADLGTGRVPRVVVIGAGMSGLLVAHRLDQTGIEPIVLEKGTEVGGTWHDNSYPGCRVDNPNHQYSFSFAQRHDWPFHFSPQPTLFEYFDSFADHFDVRRFVRFETEVVSAVWTDDFQWTITTRGADGKLDTIECDVVISAVGQLNRPSFPDIEGTERFAGTTFHSARWDHEAKLAGQRVAVIGTGASAVQFIPEIASEVGELLVFQRTPPWLGPTPEYHAPVPEGLRWLYEHVPGYSPLNRFAMFWRLGDQTLAGVTVDPEWDGGKQSVSMMNEFARQMLVQYLEEQFGDRPDLLAAVTPQYPVGAKRMLRDNGVWAGALKRDNVQLITTPIREITESGIVTEDGVTHEVDVLIYGTGFTASEFLMPIDVIGRDGVDLHDSWGDDARAYLGVAIPQFPNLFCLYGPNTNIVINGSIIYFSECGSRYILGLLRLMLERGASAIEVKADVHDAFNERIDEQNRNMAWGWSDVNSWYKNKGGRITQNWPFTLLEYWERTRQPDPGEFELT